MTDKGGEPNDNPSKEEETRRGMNTNTQNTEEAQSQQTSDVLQETSETETSKANATKSSSDHGQPSIQLNAEFRSFLHLRGAIEKYQREKSVQLIVKDSKLLKAESTRKIIPKVYHLVNQELMYHSITYICKCHGELKQKPGTRMKNVGQKRLNCPMYIRFKLSPNLQKLVLFDLHEEHNHGIDMTTFQMTPRQQVYQLSRLKRKRRGSEETADLLTKADVYVSSSQDSDKEPPQKMPRAEANFSEPPPESSSNDKDKTVNAEAAEEGPPYDQLDKPDSPLDSDESSCSDSDEEEIQINRRLLPFPIRLIGSAITSNPELIASTKELLEIQKSKLNLEKQKLLMETRLLELTNTKLELEVKQLQRSLTLETAQAQDTTIYLQAP